MTYSAKVLEGLITILIALMFVKCEKQLIY